jgi:Fe-Mn family superoxide dismutase
VNEIDRPDAALTRRELLDAAAWIGAGAAVASSLGGTPAQAQAAPVARAPAYRGGRAAKPLPFVPAALKGLSEKLLVSHHDNNYAGAVKRLNAIQQQLGALPADAAPFQFGSLKREELIAANSVALHELYFENLGGDGRADGAAAAALKAEYGTLAAWEQDLRQTALALAGGSGWVVVAYDRGANALHNWWAWDHTHQLAGGEPVLVLDMYEHAYHMDFGAAAKAYVDAFLANVRWDAVNHRLEAARRRGVA